MTWTTETLDPSALRSRGGRVYSLHELRKTYIEPARATGLRRTSLANPAQAVIGLFGTNDRVAVLGVVTMTAADLHELYGYIVEPAYRAGCNLIVAADRHLEDLDSKDFTEPIGYAWSLQRLRHLAHRYRIETVESGQPPMTPIEARMYRALREIHLAPVAQFGIGPLRADFAFPEVQLAVECDGRQYHDPDADRHRDSRLRQRGWSVLHFSGSAIYNDAASCAHKVAASVVELRQTRLSPSPIVGPQRAAGWWVRFLTWLRRFVLRTQPVALTASGNRGGGKPGAAVAHNPRRRTAQGCSST